MTESKQNTAQNLQVEALKNPDHWKKILGVKPDPMISGMLNYTSAGQEYNNDIVKIYKDVSPEEVEKFFVHFLKGVIHAKTKIEVPKSATIGLGIDFREHKYKIQLPSTTCEKDELVNNVQRYFLGITPKYIQDNIKLMREETIKLGDKDYKTENYMAAMGLKRYFKACEFVNEDLGSGKVYRNEESMMDFHIKNLLEQLEVSPLKNLPSSKVSVDVLKEISTKGLAAIKN